MPELPEVEVVRRGLDPYVRGRRIESVEVLHERAVRRDSAGTHAFASSLRGCTIRCVSRRGKYLWFPLDDGERALVAHLGMSGQLLLVPGRQEDGPHLRIRMGLASRARQLRFVDQRTFGGLFVDDLVPDDRGGHVPASVSHIARDPMDPEFDVSEFVTALRRRDSGVKRCLLDQTLVSGIGNIYADEALWRARLHYDRPARTISTPKAKELLGAAVDVMGEALAEGGTSFDSLYVDVNGESGWFDRSLAAYGREGEPCLRCGTPLVREAFMNRSSYRCPRCQRV